jgi:hypothetical protein
MGQTLLARRNITLVLITLTILNFVDLLTTLFSLSNGLYEEINLIIKFLYNQSPVLMAAYKISIPLIPFYILIKYGKVKTEDYTQLNNKDKIKTVVFSSIFLAMIWSTVFYLFVVFHNLMLIFFGVSI